MTEWNDLCHILLLFSFVPKSDHFRDCGIYLDWSYISESLVFCSSFRHSIKLNSNNMKRTKLESFSWTKQFMEGFNFTVATVFSIYNATWCGLPFGQTLSHICYAWWHISAITCQIMISTCQIFMLTCQLFMLTCQIFILTCH